MKNVLRQLLFSLLVLLINFSFGQYNSKVDSLEALLRLVENDTGRAIVLTDLSIELKYIDPSLSVKRGLEAVEVCRKSGYKKGLAKALNITGLSYNAMGNYPEAIAYHTMAISVFSELNDSIGIAKGLHNIGFAFSIIGETDSTLKYYKQSLNIAEKKNNYSLTNFNYAKLCETYSELGDYPEALEYAQRSLILSETAGDSTGQANALNEAGLILMYQKNFDAAYDYFAKSRAISEKLGDMRSTATVLNNMGLLCEKKNLPEKALEFYLKSLRIKEELMDLNSMVVSYSNIARFFQNKKEYGKAIEFNKKALKIDEQKNDKEGLCIDYLQLARIDILLKNFTEAKQFLQKAREISEKAGYRDLQVNTYLAFAEVHSAQNQFREAYDYFRLYSQTKDSMLNETNSKQIAEMQEKYESEKKQKEIAFLNKEKELQSVELAKKEAEMKRQVTQKLAFGAGFLLVLVMAVVIYRGYRQKSKSNLLLARQKQQIEIKNSHLEEANMEISKQKNEIVEKNSEILSSIRYAQRIQQAILPPEKLINAYLQDYFILYKPKDIVAGDFYWFHPVPTDVAEINSKGTKLFFAACDCTGHGVPGAFVSIVGHNSLNRSVKEFGLLRTSEILDKVNELVEETFSKGENALRDGMDIALCALEFPADRSSNFKLQYSGANNEIYIINPSRNDWPQNVKLFKNVKGCSLSADKQPIGNFIDRKPFSFTDFHLVPGDTIYAFSDGFADQFGGPKGKKFKYSQFENLLLSIYNLAMKDQEKILWEELEKWKGDLEQIDDICIWGVRV